MYTQVLHLEPFPHVERTLDSLKELAARVADQREGRFVTCAQAVETAIARGLLLGTGRKYRGSG